MPLESPTNCWTKANRAIGDAVANSAAFQSIVEKSDAASAALRVFGQQLDEPLNGDTYTTTEMEQLLAYAQVYPAIDRPYGMLRHQTNLVLPFGSSIVFVERRIRDAAQADAEVDVPGTLDREWENRTGDMIEQMFEWLEENGGPHVRKMAVTDGPGFNEKDRWKLRGMWQGIELTVDWGLVEA